MTEVDDPAGQRLPHRVGPPDAYVARDRRRALLAGEELPERVRGAALFADLSGFTGVTEALAHELGPHRGAEALNAGLDRVFHALIAQLDRFGGDVIYFSGDAVTCWLDGDDGRRAAAAAVAMQDVVPDVGVFSTPAGTELRLALKVAIVVGAARRFVVGDPEIQLMDVLAGTLVDELAATEHLAGPGEVVLGRSALRSLDDLVTLRERRVDADAGATAGVLDSLAVAVTEVDTGDDEAALPEALVRPWLLPVVYERVRGGHGAFLAELRPAIPVFVRFGGIEYDTDPDAVAKLDDFVRRAQHVLAALGGNLLQLTLGDKGAYLYAVFGSPLAHEDDAARAVAAAVELRDLGRVTAVSDLQTGITTGRLLSGTYGHDLRRTFCCLGDAVNLAARLMSLAPPGAVYVSDAVRDQAGDSFEWEPLPPLHVKGKAEAVTAHALGAVAARFRRQRRYVTDLVGRRVELDALAAAHAESLEGAGRVVGLSAEAGMGKSRLVAELVRAVRAEGRVVVFGECPAFGAIASYAPWREIWRTLLGADELLPDDDQRAAVERVLAAVDPVLPARAPLLEPVLGLSIPDTDLTAALDPKLRKASLEELLVRCLRARAADEPLVVVIEDCHWIDAVSRDLLEALVRATVELPVLFVLDYRPATEPGGGLGLVRLPQFRELQLGELEPADAERLIHGKLVQLFGAADEVPAALVDLVTSRAQGNPFYVEELLNFVRAQGVDPRDEVGLRALRTPESLHSLILSRIDTLEESPRRTLKVASVVGRSFRAPVLPDVSPELGALDGVREDLRGLRAVELVTLDRAADEAYLFKHVVTQEVTYESLPYATRAMLHERVGAHVEATAGDDLEHQLDLLAHHYSHSDNVAKQREYLLRAGAAAQAAYANAAAIDYFERAAPLVGDAERIDVLLRLGKVIELCGDWPRAEAVERDALALAERLDHPHARARCQAALAEEARRQGRYEEATALLAAAAAGFAAVDDEAGVGLVRHLAGTLAAQQGDYDQAVERYEASLEIRERLGERASIAALLSNLGVVAEYRGDYELSRRYHERALALREELGDRWAIAVSLTNLGTIAIHQRDCVEARSRFEEAMRLNREVGDAWMVAISENNLGNALRGAGDHEAARRHYASSLRAYRDYDDAWAMAFLLEDIAELAALLDEPVPAFELAGAADALRAEIGAPRAPAQEQELERTLAGVRAGTLDLEAVRHLRARGRELDAERAADVALEFCIGGGPAR